MSDIRSFVTCRNLFLKYLAEVQVFFLWNIIISSLAAILLRIIYFEIRGRGRGALWSEFLWSNVWTMKWDLLIGIRKSSSGVEEPSLGFKLLNYGPWTDWATPCGRQEIDKGAYAHPVILWSPGVHPVVDFCSLSEPSTCPLMTLWMLSLHPGPCRWGWQEVLFLVLFGEWKLWTDYTREKHQCFWCYTENRVSQEVEMGRRVLREVVYQGCSSYFWEDLLLLEDTQEEESGSWLWHSQFDPLTSLQSLQIAGKAQSPPAHVEPEDQRWALHR